jgi:hypothetical protein
VGERWRKDADFFVYFPVFSVAEMEKCWGTLAMTGNIIFGWVALGPEGAGV